MEMLRFEFMDGPESSFNGMLRTLVKGLRHSRSYVNLEEFKRLMPGFRTIEAELQKIDADVRRPKRNYIQEIMEELEQEQNDEQKIIEDLRSATIATIKTLFGKSFDFDELSFEIGKADNFPYVHLRGYLSEKKADGNLVIVREVFRAISYRYNHIFVDLSL